MERRIRGRVAKAAQGECQQQRIRGHVAKAAHNHAEIACGGGGMRWREVREAACDGEMAGLRRSAEAHPLARGVLPDRRGHTRREPPRFAIW